jgi:hypothetical protein
MSFSEEEIGTMIKDYEEEKELNFTACGILRAVWIRGRVPFNI